MQTLKKQVRQQGFEAEFQYNSIKSLYNEKLVGDADHKGKLYVDRFGREREEVYVLHNAKWELTFIELWDAVLLQASTLLPAEKKILMQEPIDIKATQRNLNLEMSGVMLLGIPRDLLPIGSELGDKQIEGLMCKGSLIDIPANKERPGVVAECWHAESIAYLVFVKAVFDGKAETTFRLSRIRLIEPAQELFDVLADYKPARLAPIQSRCDRLT